MIKLVIVFSESKFDIFFLGSKKNYHQFATCWLHDISCKLSSKCHLLKILPRVLSHKINYMLCINIFEIDFSFVAPKKRKFDPTVEIKYWYRCQSRAYEILNKYSVQTYSFYYAQLTFTTLWTNSAGSKLMVFFSYFPESRLWHFMQIVS